MAYQSPRSAPAGRTPQQIQQQQAVDAEYDRLQRKNAVVAASPQRPVPPATTPARQAPALPDAGDNYRQRYLDAIAASGIAGRLVKFGKSGTFIFADDETEIGQDRDWIALCDEVAIGWIKFSDQPDTPPEKIQGLLYDGFVLPQRSTLGDFDESFWPAGLSGAPEDPWKHQISLVLQDRENFELATFSAMSITGRRAIGILLKHYDRLQKTDPDNYPVVRLKSGGFNHRDPRVGWVSVPVLAVVGRAPKASAAIPDSSPAADMDDSIPF